METKSRASHQTRDHSRESEVLDNRLPALTHSSNALRNGLAAVDRAMLLLFVLAMVGSMLLIYRQGIYVAADRVLIDGITAGFLAAVLVVPLLLIMVAANLKRHWAGAGLVCSAYVVGFGVWCMSVFVAWQYGGIVLTTVGAAVAGIGTVMIAAGGLLIHGDWLGSLGIVAASAVVVAIRRFGKFVFG